MCVLSLHVGNVIEEEKSSVGFEPACEYFKRGKIIQCLLSAPMQVL